MQWLEAWRELRDAVERAGGPRFVPPSEQERMDLRARFELPSWFERALREVGYPERQLELRSFPPLAAIRREAEDAAWDRRFFPIDLRDEHLVLAWDLRDPSGRLVRVNREEPPSSGLYEAQEWEGATNLADRLTQLTGLYEVADEYLEVPPILARASRQLDGDDVHKVLSTRGVERLAERIPEPQLAELLYALGVCSVPAALQVIERKAARALVGARLALLASGGSAVLALPLEAGPRAAALGFFVASAALAYACAGSQRRARRDARALKRQDARARGRGPFR
jgi:hypothetical protein